MAASRSVPLIPSILQERNAMTSIFPVAAALVLSASLFFPGAEGERTYALEELFSSRQYAEYQQKAKYKDRLDIYRAALDALASHLRKQVRELNLEGVPDILGKMRSLSGYALSEPTHKFASSGDLRSKNVKNLEIRIRRIVADLDDYRLSVPHESRADFEETIRALDELRDLLLRQLFGREPPGNR